MVIAKNGAHTTHGYESRYYEAAGAVLEDVSTSGTVVEAHDLRLRLASSYAADLAVQVVGRMHRADGTSSVSSGSLLDRCLRDIHVASQHAGLGTSIIWQPGAGCSTRAHHKPRAE